MEDNLLNNIDDADLEYSIVIKKSNDILFELTDDPKERLIYETIIDGIERTAAETIKNNKVAQLPSIGCIRKSIVRQILKDNYTNFHVARKNMSESEYKTHVHNVIITGKENQAKIDKDKLILRLIKSRNKKKYDSLYINLGRAHAELFILSIFLLKEVPFDKDVQEQFDLLNNI